MGTSKHSGAIALFDREFVKTGIFAPALSRALHLAFDRRQTHDYGELVAVDAASARETITDATGFVVAIEAYLLETGLLLE